MRHCDIDGEQRRRYLDCRLGGGSLVRRGMCFADKSKKKMLWFGLESGCISYYMTTYNQPRFYRKYWSALVPVVWLGTSISQHFIQM